MDTSLVAERATLVKYAFGRGEILTLEALILDWELKELLLLCFTPYTFIFRLDISLMGRKINVSRYFCNWKSSYSSSFANNYFLSQRESASKRSEH